MWRKASAGFLSPTVIALALEWRSSTTLSEPFCLAVLTTVLVVDVVVRRFIVEEYDRYITTITTINRLRC